MKFGEYLTEKQGMMTAIKTVFKDCQPYLKELRKNRADHFFYRGTRKRGDTIIEIKPRQDRQPKDTPPEIQDYIDDYFQKKFKWRPRSQGVFTSYRTTEASSYGDLHMFFPKGKYDYIFSPEVQDLWGYIDDNGLIQYIENEPDFYYNDYEDEWLDKYGEESGNGSWYYEGQDTGESDIDDAMMVVADNEGIEPEEVNENELEWIPEISLEEYQQEKWNDERDERLSDFRNILDTFIQNKNLKKSMIDGYGAPEVIWRCKSYYIVPTDFEPFFVDKLLRTNNKDFINTIQTVDKQMLLPFKWSKKR